METRGATEDGSGSGSGGVSLTKMMMGSQMPIPAHNHHFLLFFLLRLQVTVLMMAAMGGDVAITRVLLDALSTRLRDRDSFITFLNQRDKMGQTALYISCYSAPQVAKVSGSSSSSGSLL